MIIGCRAKCYKCGCEEVEVLHYSEPHPTHAVMNPIIVRCLNCGDVFCI